ncbi:hypothetical protein [Taibaiella sp. KBW10]|uniref:hypothetical protein n=1 Tax=Taibaiella sp. KBW10 TaxID=2153357 RepID=UPI000F5A9516|nr:hypothetical protein [Taibaiella sp. KBW10]
MTIIGIRLYKNAVAIPIAVIGIEGYRGRIHDFYLFILIEIVAVPLLAIVPCVLLNIHFNRNKSKISELSDRSFESLNKLNEKSNFFNKYFPPIIINDDYFEFQHSIIARSKKFYFDTLSSVSIRKGYYKGRMYLFKIETSEGTFDRTVKGNDHFVTAIYLKLTNDYPDVPVSLI